MDDPAATIGLRSDSAIRWSRQAGACAVRGLNLRRQSSFRRIVALSILLLLNAGCTSLRDWWHNGWKVGPNYAPPAAPVACDWIEAADPRVKNEPANDCAWWMVFNDATLNGLVDTAYRQNLDLRTAGTRIIQARAERNIATGNLFPQSQTAVGAYVHGQLPKTLGLPLPPQLNIWATGFNASWELDFWGRFRRTIEATDADLAASFESYGDTLVLLFSEVATNYVQLRTFEERLYYARMNVDIQKRTVKLAEDRFSNGVASELDVRQARSNLAQTEALIPPLEAGRRQASNRLCILLGMPVSDLAGQMAAAPIPKAPAEIAIGIPADLVRRRPDIRRAERQVAAESARIGVAQADLYPRFAFNGFIGYAANDFKDLFSAKSFTGIALPSVQWNVLNYGRIVNNVQAQDAKFQGAVLEYQQTVLIAGREVEDALVGFLQAQQQAARLEESVAEANRSVELVIIQFEGGVTDFNRVYNTQGLLVTQQDQLASTRGNIALNLIQVYKALGGSWQCFAAGGGMPSVARVEEIAKPAAAPPGG